jgi:hypothetical protein
MAAYPNPDGIDIHFSQLAGSDELGDLWEAARTAGVKPGTIRVWVTRQKIEPVIDGEGRAVFPPPHRSAAAEGGAKHRPANPAANSRGPHAHAA